MQDWRHGGFGLYVHWPYCQAKCPYCDFNSHVAGDVDHSRWRDALVAEIGRIADQLGDRVLNSVYFGGGTPSLMPAQLVGAILDTASAAWTPANDIEITLEANPSSVESQRFRGYRSAGVNRISLGVQALNDTDLQRLGRLHSAREAMQAIETARTHFTRVSIDLIYARQHQQLDAWHDELRQALRLGPDHLSLYQLTIEPGTAFGARHASGGLRGLPDEELGAALYEDTQEICAAVGMPAYEVSNHAAPGNESRHNMIYWRYGDFVGIGPGAHGRLTLENGRYATECTSLPSNWLARVENDGSGESGMSSLARRDQAEEYLMMSLRLSEGIDLKRFSAISDAPLNTDTIRRLSELDLVRTEEDRLMATPDGRLVLNFLIRELLASR